MLFVVQGAAIPHSVQETKVSTQTYTPCSCIRRKVVSQSLLGQVRQHPYLPHCASKHTRSGQAHPNQQ
jgi:hypothetical protein